MRRLVREGARTASHQAAARQLYAPALPLRRRMELVDQRGEPCREVKARPTIRSHFRRPRGPSCHHAQGLPALMRDDCLRLADGRLSYVLHWPRLCSPLSSTTLATAVTNTGVWWKLYPPNTTFGRFFYPRPRSTFLLMAFGAGNRDTPRRSERRSDRRRGARRWYA